MISSIGRDVVASCASARAGLTRESELDFTIFDNESDDIPPVAPVVGHVISGVTEGFVRLGRLVRLGERALKDLLSYSNIGKEHLLRTGLFLNLSSGYYLNLFEAKEQEEIKTSNQGAREDAYSPPEMELRKDWYSYSLIPILCKLTGITLNNRQQKVYFGDHAGIASAIQDASSLLQKEQLDRCIIGGIDSYVEQDNLEIFSEFGILKTKDNSDGFLPGESASFFLAERYDRALSRGAKIQGIIESFSIKAEASHRFSEDPPTGFALAESISETLDKSTGKGKDVGLLIGNLNGDSLKAKEWGNALVRITAKWPHGEFRQWYPALSFGETGAATGAISICLGVRAFVRDYSKTDNILIWLANDDGHKGSIYLRKYHR